MSYEEQDVIWRVALASYDPREMRVWTRYLEERNPAIRCTGYRSSRPLLERLAPAHRPAESLEKRCERIYRSWGVSTCDANKRYLTGALRVMMGSDHRLAIRKEILGPVAEEYGLTVAAVDSALRRLLETLDETGTQTWRDFRKEYGLERRKVTIGRLLYALESRLSQQ